MGFKNSEGMIIRNANDLETVSEVIRSGSYPHAYSEVYIAKDKHRQKYIVVHNYAVVPHGCPIKVHFQDSGISSTNDLNIDSVGEALPPMMACPAVMSAMTYYYRVPYDRRYKMVQIHYFNKGHIDYTKAHHITKLEMPKLIKKR